MLLAISWVFPWFAIPHAATSNSVLFDREVVRILNQHCVMCHIDGGLSFSIATYEETWLQRGAIHDQILAGHMPPWAAVPGYGEFANVNELTLREKRFIVSWVEGLGPRNAGEVFFNVLELDGAIQEEIRAQIDFSVWELSEPDLILDMHDAVPAMTPAAQATTRIQRTVIDPGLDSQRWLSGIEYQPDDHSEIRAVVFTLEETGQWLTTWTPWHGFRRLPDNVAYRLDAGARIVAEFHTTKAGQELIDPGLLGLQFTDMPASAVSSDKVILVSTEIPAGTNRHRLHGETRLGMDSKVMALWLEMPASVKSIEVSALHPDGKVEVLLYALDIPQEWPTPYLFKTPVDLPAETLLSLTAYVSNESQTPVDRFVRLTLSSYSYLGSE